MKRIVIVVGLLAAGAAQAQTPQLPPGVALPPGVTIPPNAQSMTPEQAKAAWAGLDPATKEALKQAAAPYKAQVEADPGLKAQIKAWIKSMLGK